MAHDFAELVPAAYRSAVNRRGSKCIAVITTVAALTLAACGALPPSQTGQTGTTPGTDLPSPTTVIPSETAKPSPAPSTPTPEPTPTKPPQPAGPNCAKLKCIALTYDDGPAEYTSRLAQILQQHKVKATFFMLGDNVKRYPQAVKDVQATGSELANHSWNHPDLSGLSNSGMRSQLERTNHEIETVAGTKVILMRPPYGANNHRLDVVARDLDLAEIYWNVDTEDWKYKDTDRLIEYMSDAAARDEVVLMHDIHESTVDAAPAIFKGLKKRGFTMVTVSELYPKLRPGGHYPLYQGRGFAKKSDYPKR